MYWEAFGAIATAVYAFLFLIALAIAWWQLREMSKARRLESILRVLEYVHDPELRECRWLVFRKGDALHRLFKGMRDNSSWDDLDQQVNGLFSYSGADSSANSIFQIQLALKTLDNVAGLIKEKHAPFDTLATNLMKNEVLRWWWVFEDYIEHRRKINPGPHYNPGQLMFCGNLEWLKNKVKELD